jgi:hypothetical protein
MLASIPEVLKLWTPPPPGGRRGSTGVGGVDSMKDIFILNEIYILIGTLLG